MRTKSHRVCFSRTLAKFRSVREVCSQFLAELTKPEGKRRWRACQFCRLLLLFAPSTQFLPPLFQSIFRAALWLVCARARKLHATNREQPPGFLDAHPSLSSIAGTILDNFRNKYSTMEGRKVLVQERGLKIKLQ